MAYKVLFFYWRGVILKELGEFLKEHRESNGVGIEEAAQDLNIKIDELENIEEGNIRAFKDVLSLKTIIKNYAKYLGLDPEKVADEFNDFMFEHTSKLSLSDILEAEKKINENNAKKIKSPYTIIRKKKINKKKLLFVILAILIFFLLIVLILKLSQPKAPVINSELKRGEVYESTHKVNYI